jgi:hypothetical protein
MRMKKRTGIAVVVIASGLVASSYNACSQSYDLAKVSASGESGQSVPGGPDDGTNPPPGVNLTVHSQTVEINSVNKVDILIVDDNSGSMAFEQANMASRFNNFITELSGIDWQLAITTTDVTNDADKKDGRLLSMGAVNNSPTSILTSAMSPELAQQLFASTIQRPVNEGSAYEQGIFATHRAIERSLVENASDVNLQNMALIRPEATLAVVVVTDADETGNGDKNKPQVLLDLVKSKLGASKRFAFHSIIVKPGDVDCENDHSELTVNGKIIRNINEEPGQAYAALSGLTGGLIGSVCAADYASQLQQIGHAVADSVRTLTLDCLPQDTSGDGIADVSATDSTGQALQIAEVAGLLVTFTTDLPMGMTHLQYSCLPEAMQSN